MSHTGQILSFLWVWNKCFLLIVVGVKDNLENYTARKLNPTNDSLFSSGVCQKGLKRNHESSALVLWHTYPQLNQDSWEHLSMLRCKPQKFKRIHNNGKYISSSGRYIKNKGSRGLHDAIEELF